MTPHIAFLAIGLALQAQAPAQVPALDTLVTIRGLAPRSLRSQYFVLDSAQAVQVAVVGGEPRGRTAVRKFLEHGIFQSKESQTWDQDAWPGNAWILDVRTRQVVWELRTAQSRTDGDGLRSFEGTVRLPAGTYEMSYAALFPVSNYWSDDHDWRVRDADATAAGMEKLGGPFMDDGAYHSFRAVLRGTGRRVTRDAAGGESTTPVLAIRGNKPKALLRAGFELDKTTALDVYLLGEGDDGWADYGWIMNAADRRVVWTARSQSWEPAGGARKNRVVRQIVQLPAGRYVAGFVTDDAHELGHWNATPPFDPSFYGLTLWTRDAADRKSVRAFEYDPVPSRGVFVSLTRLNNDELRWQRFSVARPLDVQIFALGESTSDDMQDYGWIVDARGHAAWRMTYDESEAGGGATKNRVYAGTLHLEPGIYTAYARTDGSHSYGGGWNAGEPMDAEYWGLTIGAAAAKDSVLITRLTDDDDRIPGVLARVTRVRGGRTGETRFHLDRRTGVAVYAVGEGSGGDMYDYGVIRDSLGREVWRMQYEETEAAGGASKNRRIERSVSLEPGSYTLRFETDGSHGWKDWNSDPPEDPLSYGITLFREK